MQRRRLAWAAAALLLGLDKRAAGNSAGPAPRRVPIVASRFAFSVLEIHATRGDTLTLILSAVDFVHGFALPDLALRADVPPGRPVELTLHLDRVGRFAYLCDNFCGEGHDRMAGHLVVHERTVA